MSAPPRRAKVLIAEDEPSIVASLEFLLQSHAYEVRVARDGAEAVRMTESFLPDLLLLDVMMPVKNGFEVCRTIRQNPALSAVKILMLTARGREAERDRGLGAGADDYMTKPFSTQELIASVRGLLHE
jgi:DNA-binding response OmpR family regulator